MLAFIFGFLGGVAVGSFLHLSLAILLAGALLSFSLYGYGFFVPGKGQKIISLCAIALFSFSAGAARVAYSPLYQESQLAQFENKKIIAEGVVAQDADVRETNTYLTVRLDTVKDGSETYKVRENILVSTSIYPDFKYGDRVEMNVTLRIPKPIEGDAGRVFDYAGYLRVRGIWYTASFTKVILLSAGNGNPIVSALFRIKHVFTHALEDALPAPESNLLAGLLLGTKQSLGKAILTEFQLTGTSHIVVLSGYNITIVAESIMAILAFLPAALAFLGGLAGVLLFTILAGGGASAWRAAVMVLVALFAKKLNRTYSASRAFGFAVIVMLAPNPLLLIFDPSFQLSVLATIGIIFVSPLVEPYFARVPKRFGLREVVSATTATQIVVLPYLIYNTGIVSLISLPVNILILGTIPITMLFGFLTGAAGLISLYLSFIPALPTYLLLWYQLTVVHLGAILPFGAVKLPAFSFEVLAAVYCGIAASLFLRWKKQKKTISHS